MVEFSLWIGILLVSVVCSSRHDNYNIDGTTVRGWEFVRNLFKENFVEQRDLGASLAIYHRGKLVVDLWGGWFDRSFTKPYDNNTLQLVFSSTKGLVAIAAALCVQKGLLDYLELVTKYWPEYGQYGKENTTVADILSHRAGLPSESGPPEQILNWTAMVHSLEQQRPLWPPGTAHSYHALTYGWLAGELIRRVDPKKRSVGKFVRDEIANQVKIEFYIGLPSEQAHRVSSLTLSLENLRAMNDSIKGLYTLYNDPQLHQAEIPAANGITNARSLARLYASLISSLDYGKQKRLLNKSVLNQATKSNTPIGELDFLTDEPSSFGMGFSLLDQAFPFFKSAIFGHPGKNLQDAFPFIHFSFYNLGAGGSIGFAVPSKDLSFGFAMNQLDLEPNNNYPRIRTILEKVAAKINDNN
jgi:CubicO group peptidase (beta-lactamase class C family)